MYSDTAEPIKLVFAGSMGAGKSTAIGSIADGEPISTDMPMSEGATDTKSTTTVAFDFATVWLNDGTPLHIYGMPGQDYFSHMRSILLQGALGVVLVLDGIDPDIGSSCEAWLHSLRENNSPTHVVIGITKTDMAPNFSLAPVRAALRRCEVTIPVFTFDARSTEQTTHLVRALLVLIG
ncbi:MAG TPA: GTPase [Rhodanobacter sp.]|nr:GTPase [Rhodanobacter sp.]